MSTEDYKLFDSG